jgi:hypothetical protein
MVDWGLCSLQLTSYLVNLEIGPLYDAHLFSCPQHLQNYLLLDFIMEGEIMAIVTNCIVKVYKVNIDALKRKGRAE